MSIANMSDAETLTFARSAVDSLSNVTPGPKICSILESCKNGLGDEGNMKNFCGIIKETAERECQSRAKEIANNALLLSAAIGLWYVYHGTFELKKAFDNLNAAAASIAEIRPERDAIRATLNALEAKLPPLLQLIERRQFNRAIMLASECRDEMRVCLNKLTEVIGRFKSGIDTFEDTTRLQRSGVFHSLTAIIGSVGLAKMAKSASAPHALICAALIGANALIAAGNARALYLSTKQTEELRTSLKEIEIADNACKELLDRFQKIHSDAAAQLEPE